MTGARAGTAKEIEKEEKRRPKWRSEKQWEKRLREKIIAAGVHRAMMTPYEKKKAIERVKQYEKQGMVTKDICFKLNLTKRTVQRLRAEAKLGFSKESKIAVEESLSIPATVKIDIGLNQIEFCDKYLTTKPNTVQRIIIKAFYSLEMNDFEVALLREWKEKGWTTWGMGQKYRELVVLAGMKGGKTTLASFFVQIEEYELFKVKNPWEHWGFVPGEEIWILNVATDKDQAKDTIFAKTKASLQRSPYFKARAPREIGNSFHFRDTNVRIKSGHSNSASLVGKTCKLVLLDELDRFKAKGGKYSADAVYQALDSSTDPFAAEGKIISISSLVHDRGKMVDLYEKSKTIPDILGFWLPEWEMQREKYKMYRPDSAPQDYFLFQQIKIPIEHRSKFDKDPEGFLRDKACISGFTRGKYYRMPELIDKCFEDSQNEGYRNPIRDDGIFEGWFRQKNGFNYYMHLDASLNHDAFGIGIAHRDGSKGILDLIHRIDPKDNYGEIDVQEATDFILLLLERFPGIELITYDTWAVASIIQALKKRGKEAENLYIKKTQHDLLKELIYDGRFRTYDSYILKHELKNLELTGDKVDHPDVEGASKDCADAASGAIWHCMSKDSGISAGLATSAQVKEEDKVSKTGFKKLSIKRRHIWDGFA